MDQEIDAEAAMAGSSVTSRIDAHFYVKAEVGLDNRMTVNWISIWSRSANAARSPD